MKKLLSTIFSYCIRCGDRYDFIQDELGIYRCENCGHELKGAVK